MTRSLNDARGGVPDRRRVAGGWRRAVPMACLMALLAGCSDPDGEGGQDGRGGAEETTGRAGSTRTPATWEELLAAAHDELTSRDAVDQAALAPRAATPRMHRLLRADAPPAFTATGPAPEPAEPMTVALGPGFGAQERDGTIMLKPGAQLMSAEGLDIPASEISELLLRVRVARGAAIEVVFHIKYSREVSSVSLPVAPSGEWQTLRVSQPLLMHNDLENVVDRIRVVSPVDLGETLMFQIEPLLIARPGAVYSLTTHGSREELVGGSLRPASWQSTDGELVVPWPQGAAGRQLRGAFALRRLGDADRPSAATLAVSVETPDGRRVNLSDQAYSGDDGWDELVLDLPVGVEPAALVLRSDGLAPGEVALHADWRVLDTSRPARRVVLLVMDTLRADALGCYGRAGDPTPALDSLAADGVLFARCYAQAHWTRPSMPSIMTGLYTPETGVHTKTDQLPAAYDTLAERFAAAGWRTAAFIANAQAGPATGLGQGWDELVLCLGDDSAGQFRDVIEPRTAQLPEDDLLLYVHLMEPHGPYGPPERPAGHVEPEGQPVEHSKKYDRAWMESPTVESRNHWYDQDVRSMDRAIGGFLQRVVGGWERDGEPVVVAALSDHGEWLGEEGLWGHGKGLLRPEVVHTPLIVRAPGRIDAGRVWDGPVQNIDVGATLLDLVGAPLDDGGADHGRSLLPRLAGAGHAPFALSSNVSGKQTQFSFWSPQGGAFLENQALLQVLSLGEGFRTATAADRAREPALSALQDAFVDSARELQRTHWLDVQDSAQALDAESLAQLRALGYLGY